MAARKPKLTKELAIRELWGRGILDYKRRSNQELIRDYIKKSEKDIITILASRRQGKSYELLIQAVELCLGKKDAIVKYICPRLKMVSTIVHPNMKTILTDCPANMRPEWKEQAKMYVFPNGSQIQFAGTDNNSHENLRGGAADLCIVDEAGFCDHLGYVINDILAPTTDTTDGKVILISTPSKSPNHEFITDFVKPLIASGEILKLTIDDNPYLSEEKKNKIAQRFPQGKKDPGYLREYLCEIIEDDDSKVIPEFTDNKKEELVYEYKKPAYYDPYVSGDVGFRDLTVYLFGYWDFINATLVIEDELVLEGPTTQEIADRIKEKEAQVFTDNIGEPKSVYLRVMDNDLIMINDLQRLHGLNFVPTAKDNLEAQVNHLRMIVGNNKLAINPRCKHLIYHLSIATWTNSDKKKFSHLPNTPDQKIKGGHADALPALIYMLRNVVRSKNPYPDGYDSPDENKYFISRQKAQKSQTEETIRKMLNIKVN